MPTIAHPAWLLAGLLMCAVGVWLVRWANRNNVAAAMKDATVSATLETIAKRGRPDVPPELKAKMSEITGAEGKTGKAKTVASYSIRNSLSQLFGAAGFILLMAGLVTAVIGIFGT